VRLDPQTTALLVIDLQNDTVGEEGAFASSGAAAASIAAGSLRMMAEKHYLTDVAAGALIGATCGVVVPLLHRRGGPLSSRSMSVAAQGPALTLTGRF